MNKIWIVENNNANEWNFTGIEIIKGKREMNEFLDRQISFLKCIEIPDLDDTFFLNQIFINLNVEDDSRLNTTDVFRHPNFKIQCSFNSDLNFQNSEGFNYFSTIVNLESINIFGSAIFFKIANKKLVNLEKEELLSLLVNFYFLKTFRLRDGKFEEIGFNNFEPEINMIFKNYHVKKFNNWLVFSDDSKSNLNNLEQRNNDIKNFNNLIWLKIKQHMGDIYQAIDSLKLENNRDGDLRGLYEDLDINHIKTVFFN